MQDRTINFYRMVFDYLHKKVGLAAILENFVLCKHAKAVLENKV